MNTVNKSYQEYRNILHSPEISNDEICGDYPYTAGIHTNLNLGRGAPDASTKSEFFASTSQANLNLGDMA